MERTKNEFEAMLQSALSDIDDLDSSSNATGAPPAEFGEAFADMMRRLAEETENAESQAPGSGADDNFDSLLDQFENNDAYKGLVEGMMKSLVAKDILYEPMKEMHEKYPKWLSENKASLPPAEYQNYVKQFGYVEQIMYIYETKGDDGLQEVMKLLKEMQDCGQVPAGIVKQLAPDLEFDENGMPKVGLDGLDPNKCSIL